MKKNHVAVEIGIFPSLSEFHMTTRAGVKESWGSGGKERDRISSGKNKTPGPSGSILGTMRRRDSSIDLSAIGFGAFGRGTKAIDKDRNC